MGGEYAFGGVARDNVFQLLCFFPNRHAFFDWDPEEKLSGVAFTIAPRFLKVTTDFFCRFERGVS